ncbi:hypothetical protein Fmac_014995 [Flemingia macrophylla]|uniref:Uncharacterized protein n=1 Tax=Flemingia macrophylla TaxID=520843 RepID=A0ABD1MDU4_9FABA
MGFSLSNTPFLFQADVPFGPTTLPPPRLINHQIHLHPSSSLVNVYPYRYPHFQTSEIEFQVAMILSFGMICPSCSPFSSSVLLLKKKYGCWHLYVDYCALN